MKLIVVFSLMLLLSGCAGLTISNPICVFNCGDRVSMKD